MRRALVVFAERMPELSILGGWFALPGLVATALAALVTTLPGLVQPMLYVVLMLVPLLLATPLAMASIASVFGDLRERPFVRITWRGVARAVIGAVRDGAARDGAARDRVSRDLARPDYASRDGAALYAEWVGTSIRRYLATTRATKGSGLHTMLAFVDGFRHGGVPSAPERLAAMAEVLPTRAFATMAVAQFAALLLLPALAVLATLGVLLVLSVSPARAGMLLALSGGLAFTTALFLQVFIALVDVMLYDLAYAMTES
jgi:drug/metabolite transporter superfamily protein YnfA